MHRKIGLRLKISIYILVIMLVLGTLLVFLCYRNVYKSSMEMYRTRGENIVQIAANMVDGDQIQKYVETGEKDDYYEELLKDFNNLKEHTQDIAYLYLFVPDEDHFTYILDAYT